MGDSIAGGRGLTRWTTYPPLYVSLHRMQRSIGLTKTSCLICLLRMKLVKKMGAWMCRKATMRAKQASKHPWTHCHTARIRARKGEASGESGGPSYVNIHPMTLARPLKG